MSKNKKKSNLKDTSSEAFSGIIEDLSGNNKHEDIVTLDPAQIDLEEQIADEIEEREYKPRFKDPKASHKMSKYVSPITNANLNEALVIELIESGACDPDEFV